MGLKFERLVSVEDLTTVGAFGGIHHRANDESSVVRKAEVTDSAVAFRPHLVRRKNGYAALLHHKPRVDENQPRRKQSDGRSRSNAHFHG